MQLPDPHSGPSRPSIAQLPGGLLANDPACRELLLAEGN